MGLKECFVGEGWYAGQFLAPMLTLRASLVNGPFFPIALIVLVGQAGGSKPHLASGKKTGNKENMHIYRWECWGRVAALDTFILKGTHFPLADIKSFGLDQEQVCAAIVSDVLY